MNIIEIRNLDKSYDGINPVLTDITLDIKEGEFAVLVGPSGCGKTTLLKMINKLIPLSDGFIRIHGRLLSEWDTIELRRSIGYVIQQIGLFPHLSVRANIGFVPSISGEKREHYMKRVTDLIRLVGLSETDLDRFPHELSGGQAQRIGVARALAAEPAIILMDEPFGAVDEITRRKLQDELKTIHQTLKKTILFVTHDIGEAIRLADKIVLFNEGRIEQAGTPEDMVFRPANEYVRSFFGVKGFKESPDENELMTLYEAILSGKMTMAEVLERCQATR